MHVHLKKKERRCFNPAEAEEWFRRYRKNTYRNISTNVSIQPKPKNGLEEVAVSVQEAIIMGFNPAEAEEWFRS